MWPGVWFANFDTDDNSEQNLQKGRDLVFTLTLSQSILVSVFIILNFLLVVEKPPTPPSFSADVKKERILDAIKILLSDKTYIILFFSFGIG